MVKVKCKAYPLFHRPAAFPAQTNELKLRTAGAALTGGVPGLTGVIANERDLGARLRRLPLPEVPGQARRLGRAFCTTGVSLLPPTECFLDDNSRQYR